jgi:hypothetical protein
MILICESYLTFLLRLIIIIGMINMEYTLRIYGQRIYMLMLQEFLALYQCAHHAQQLF